MFSSPMVTWWELLVPADDLESAAAGMQMTVQQMIAQCLAMTYAGVELTAEKVEAVCAGGEAYAYRVVARE